MRSIVTSKILANIGALCGSLVFSACVQAADPVMDIPEPMLRKPCPCKSAEKNALNMVATAEKVFGKDSAQYADALVELGKIRYYQKNYKTAETALLSALALQDKKLPAAHNKIAFTHGLLASLYKEQKNEAKATGEAKQAIAIFEANRRSGAKLELQAVEQMANLYMLEGDTEKARLALASLVPLAEKQYGKDSLQVAQHLETLSLFNRTPEKHLEGARMLLRAAAIRQSKPGSQQDASLVWDRQSLALLLIGNKKYQQGSDILLRETARKHKYPDIDESLLSSCQAAAWLLRQDQQEALAKRLDGAAAGLKAKLKVGASSQPAAKS